MNNYVPRLDYWLRYYQNLGTSYHPSFHQPERRNQGQSVEPAENVGEKSATSQTQKPEVTVQLISPAQQVVEQAASEIKREKDIKRKLTNAQNHSPISKRQRNTHALVKNGDPQF